MKIKWPLDDCCFRGKLSKVDGFPVRKHISFSVFCVWFITVPSCLARGGFRIRSSSQFARRVAEEEAHAGDTLHLWKRLVRIGSGSTVSLKAG